MKNLYSLENAINFLRKGIALSLLILLSVTTHSNPIDKNTARKTGGDFLLEKPAIPLPTSKREDISSYAENKALSSKTETVALAGRSDNEAPLPPPPAADDNEPNNSPATATILTATFDTNHSSTVDILNVNCHNNTDIDIYKINLETGYTYTVNGALYDKDSDRTSYTLDVNSEYSINGGTTWLEWGDMKLKSLTVPGGAIYFKILPYDSEGNTGTYAARIDIKKAGTTGCSYVFLPVSGQLTSDAGTSQQVTVTTAASCFWSATSNVDWITLISGQSATGSGTVVYSCTANTEWVSRTGTLTIAGQIYTVTQLHPSITADAYEGTNGNNTPAEAYLLIPEFTANAAAPLSISAANCHNTSDVDFYKINLEADYHYTVSATLHDQFSQPGSYTLDVKISYSTDGSTWSSTEDSQLSNTTVKGGGTLYFKIVPFYDGRVGTYAATINLSKTAGCTYVFSPASKVATSQAGTGQITVTASPSCTASRTATVASGGSWLTLTSGYSATTDPWVVGYSYSRNELLTSRTGTITIGDETYRVTQLLPQDSYEGNNGNNTLAQAYPFTPVFTQNASTVSISPANCHLGTDIDFYKINLDAGYSYSFSGEIYDSWSANNHTLNVNSYYSTDGSNWISVGYNRKLSLRATGSALYLKIEPSTAGYTGTYAARIDIKKETSVACMYGLPVTRVDVSMEEGLNQSAELRVTGQSCLWTATSNANWITLTSRSGTGAGNVGYAYKANGAPASRTGTITIAGFTYTISQAGRPLTADSYEGDNGNNTPVQAYAFTPVFTQNAHTLSISATCHNNNDIDFYKIDLEAGYLYTVSGVLYDVENNWANNNNYTLDVKIHYSTDATTAVSAWENWENWGGRQLKNLTVQGTLYFKIQPYYAGRTGSYGAKIEIKKVGTVGCTYALPITRGAVTWEAGANQQVAVTTGSTAGLSCFRSASSNDTWITLTSGQSGTDSGQVVYSYEANTTQSSRTGTISIADKTYTVTQGIQPDGYEGNNGNNTPVQAYAFTPEFTAENASTVSISEANCHSTTDVDYYKIILDDRYSYTVSGMLYEQYNQINNSRYTLNAKISYSGDGSVWSREHDRQLPGMTVPGGILYLKIEPSFEGNMGSYAASIEIKKAAKVGCAYTLSASGKEVSSEAGIHQENVTTGESCLWTATSNVDWITLTSGQNSTGSGTVGYSYSANTERALRTGTISIAGQTYTVTQLPPSLQPDNYEENNTPAQAYPFTPVFTENASTVSITAANCHTVDDVDIYKINLEAVGNRYTISGALYDKNSWSSSGSYTLDAKISYSTDGSNWSDWSSGWGWGSSPLVSLEVQGSETLYLKIVPKQAGRTGTYAATINLSKIAGCTYSFDPKSKEATSAGGSGRITVTASSSCTSSWGATTNATWITLTPRTTGSGFIDYTYEANTERASREGTITIDDKHFKVTQLPPSLQPDSYEGINGNNTSAQAHSFTPAFTQNASTVSISGANCHQVADVDFYKINLESGYFYTVSLALKDGKNDSHNYTLDAKVYYSTDGSDWSNGADAGFSLGPVQGGNLYIKIEPWSQGRVGTYSATIDISIIGGCSTSLSVASKSVEAPQGTGVIEVTKGSLCRWTATSNALWITVPPQSGATGSGSVNYTYQENIVTEARKGTLTVAGQTYEVNQAAAPACTFTLPVPANVTAAAGDGSVTVGALRSNCVWAATSNVPWITVPPQSGATGSGSVAYSYQENIVTEARKGTLTVAGQTYEVNQAAAPACTFTLPVPANVTAAAGDGSVTVGALRSNCVWNATSNVEWIIVPPLSGATGPGSVAYSYQENIVTESRKGTLTVAGQTYEVNQAAAPACTFTLPVPANVTAAAGDGSVTVGALRSNCTWTATSNVPWITVPPQSGATGPGSVGYSYTENKTATSRTGTIMVANQAYTVNQAATPCTFTLASSAANVTKVAGSGSLSVTALPGDCTWTASSNVEWITLTSGQSGTTGSGKVDYSYTENKTGTSRKGIIIIADRTFTLTQSVVTGIEPSGHVKIFPNPAGDFVTVDLSAGNIKYVSLKIVNQFGQTVYEWNNPNQTLQIPLKGFATGLYFIQIQGEEKVWVEKLVIKH